MTTKPTMEDNPLNLKRYVIKMACGRYCGGFGVPAYLQYADVYYDHDMHNIPLDPGDKVYEVEIKIIGEAKSLPCAAPHNKDNK